MFGTLTWFIKILFLVFVDDEWCFSHYDALFADMRVPDAHDAAIAGLRGRICLEIDCSFMLFAGWMILA